MKLTVHSIQQKLWKKFDTVQKDIFMMMDSAPGNDCVSDFVRN